MMEKSNPKHKAFEVLKIRDFTFFIYARFALTIGVLIQSVIVEWQVYEITHDPLQLGLIGLAEAIPFICIALFAGHVADVVSRKKIIFWATLFLTIGTAFLCWYSFQLKALLPLWGTTPIYAAIVITGLARGFIGPSYFAFLTQLIPKEQYATGAAWNSSTWQIGAVSGPAIAGLLYGFFGPTVSYFVDVIIILSSLLFIAIIPERPIAKKNLKEPLLLSIKSGLDFVFSNQLVLGALSLDLFAVLFGGAVALLPVFAGDILKVGPQGLGFLRAAPAIGAVIMGLFLAFNPLKRKAGKILLWSVAFFGLFTIGFAFSVNFYVSLLLLALIGAADNVSVVVRSTILQLNTPDEMRGRVSSVNSVFIGSSNEIGAFESGAAAKLMGLVPSVVFGGIMTLIVVATTAKVAPKLKAMDTLN